MCSPGTSWSWTVGAGAPIKARIGQRWHFVGDSITFLGWFSEPGGFVDQIQALIGGSIVVTSSGLGGDTVVNIASRVHERIAIYRPDVIVVEYGVNDTAAIPPTPTTGTFQAAYDSILVGCRAECPNAQILCISIFVHFEQWLSGPLRWAPSSAGQIDVYNSQIAASAATYGAAYSDVRAAALLYEQANNTPEPGAAAGILTSDSLHPTSAGKILMGTTAMAQVVVG